jgi:uncharacterized protein (TIRG00374 family)
MLQKNKVDHIPLHEHFLKGQKFKTVFIIVLLSILGYFLFTFLAGWENVMQAFRQVGIYGIIIAFTLSLINIGMRFLRWQYFLKVLGYFVPWRKNLRIYLSGFALTTTPGKTGEALRSIFLKDYGIPFRKCFGAFLSERTSDLLAVTVLASTGLWLFPSARPILILVAGLIVSLFFAIHSDKFLKLLEKLAKRIFSERFTRIIDFLLETLHSFRSCFTAKVLIKTFAFGLIAWSAEAIALKYIVHLLGHEITLMQALFIYGFSLVIGGITLLPGGLGGAEVTMLQMLIMQNVPAPAAVAATLVIRITSLWFSVLLGMIALPKDRILWKQKTK